MIFFLLDLNPASSTIRMGVAGLSALKLARLMAFLPSGYELLDLLAK